MQTKRIRYRSGLLIGLLSLNTLSSCINATRGLGMGGGNSKSNGKDAERGDNGNSSQAGGKYDNYKEYGKEALKYAGSFVAGVGTKAVIDYCSQSRGTGSHSSGYNSSGSNNTGYGWGMDTPNR